MLSHAQRAFLRACKNGDAARAQKLLDQAGAGIMETRSDGRGATGLRLASRRGHRQVVRVLCERGANVDAKDEKGGVTPLLAAASENRVDVVAELLAHQPDLEVQARPHNMTIHGTALHHACDKGFVDVAALLCDAGANLEAATHISLCTPLLYACETGGPEMVRLLLSRGARSEARNLLRDTGLHLAASQLCLQLLWAALRPVLQRCW